MSYQDKIFTKKDITMLRIDTNIILVKCIFGTFFIDNTGKEICDPDSYKCEVDSLQRAWYKYTFLNKKKVHSSTLLRTVELIVERINHVYQQQ